LAQSEAHKAIELYEHFEFLYQCLLSCFQLFDNNGRLKEAPKTKDDFETALALLQTLNHPPINQEIKSIHACKKELFYFTQIAKKIIEKLSQGIDNEVLQQFCLAYQTQKNRIKLKKNPERKAVLQRKEKHILDFLKQYLGDQYESIKAHIYSQLELIVQSSSAVECINSIIRPYLNTSKNQVSQETLNLIMFYHNHSRFRAGKRKGKTPAEIFYGQPQEKHWLELLHQKAGI
jgi:hypothetical protein